MQNQDPHFCQQRNDTFDRVITLIESHIKKLTPSILISASEMAPESLQASAQKEVWTLMLHGIQYLKCGAPDHQPGSMTEALSRISLRSGNFAAALKIKPPQFQQLLFQVEYSTGHDAALFFCRRLIEAAEGDLLKSRQIIQQRLLMEKPVASTPEEAETLKRQMAYSFNVLADTYGEVCKEFKSSLAFILPPRPATPRPGQSFTL